MKTMGANKRVSAMHVPKSYNRAKTNFLVGDVHTLERVVCRTDPNTVQKATDESYDYEQPASRACLCGLLPHLQNDLSARLHLPWGS